MMFNGMDEYSRRLENLVAKHMKMEKTPRYTQRERNMVLSYAAQYKDIIENKRTDAESNRKKDEVWRQIAKDFNARVYHQRSSKQLRQLYKNMKLLLKKDLCGEGKCNRTFIDLLNTISQQESVSQYIAEQMSPNSFNNSNNNNNHSNNNNNNSNNHNDNSTTNNNNNQNNNSNNNNNNNDNNNDNNNSSNNNRRKKCDNEYDDSKTLFNYNEAMDTDVIVIKSEDITDNEHSTHDMDDDDDDCLSPKGIPEVCLEEEDEELFATDLRQQRDNRHESQQMQFLSKSSLAQHTQLQMQTQQEQAQSNQVQQALESAIQGIGGSIRVGSIGSMANMKALQTTSSTSTSSNNNIFGNNATLNLSANTNGGSEALNLRNSSAEQRFLLNGLGLSAVHSTPSPLPAQPTTLASLSLPISLPSASPATNNNLSMQKNEQHGGRNSPQNSSGMISSSANNVAHQMLLNINNAIGHYNAATTRNNCIPQVMSNSRPMSSRNLHKAAQNDYFLLGIEERKLKIELLNAQIDYWKKLTSKLDESPANSSNHPSCACHFPGKCSMNSLPVPTTTAS